MCDIVKLEELLLNIVVLRQGHWSCLKVFALNTLRRVNVMIKKIHILIAVLLIITQLSGCSCMKKKEPLTNTKTNTAVDKNTSKETLLFL